MNTIQKLKYKLTRLKSSGLHNGMIIYIAEVYTGVSRMRVVENTNMSGVIVLKSHLSKEPVLVHISKIGLMDKSNPAIACFKHSKQATSFLKDSIGHRILALSFTLKLHWTYFYPNEYYYIYKELAEQNRGADYDGDLGYLNGKQYVFNHSTDSAVRLPPPINQYTIPTHELIKPLL